MKPDQMKNEQTKTELVPPPNTNNAAPAFPRRRVRRQLDHNLITGDGPGSLLSFEDPTAIQAIRQSVRDRLNCHSPIDLVFVELATSNAWQALRAAKLDAATVDTEVADQAEAVNRDYCEIDDISRTALIYQDPQIARVLRIFNLAQRDYQRSLLQIVRPPSIRAAK